MFTTFIKKPDLGGATVRAALRLWLAYIAVGSLLNAVKFAGFEHHGLSKPQVGVALSTWGESDRFSCFDPWPSSK